MADEERRRLARADRSDKDGEAWRHWGPYLSERSWGTVREDYSADGDAWNYFPFGHAHSRAFRWSEDGMGGVCDDEQVLCLALALWNGRDPILKERMFGLTGSQGNHGEDVKDYWWFMDATPTSSWLRWRYHYPQQAFPYEQLLAENQRRDRHQPEFELLDTGIFADNRYWVVTVDWAKADPEDLLWRIEVTNAGPDEATIDVLPTMWYRNVWSWNTNARRPSISVTDEDDGEVALTADHHLLEPRIVRAGPGAEALFCDNETNSRLLWGSADGPDYPKDGVGEHVITDSATVNPARTGTKAALRYHLTLPPCGRVELRLRLAPPADTPHDLGAGFAAIMDRRKAEADDFYSSLTPADATEDEAAVMRQAFAGMLWSKQFFHYDVERWLDGDPGQPTPPPSRKQGRNSTWRHLNNRDIISMPDPWEYPWYAAWDLAFHCVALAHLDPTFAKQQLILLCREWYMHPNGQLPAYEWAFGDVNPPVHAWAALKVWEIDRLARGPDTEPDMEFLERVFHKLLLNFTWWVNRKDAEGLNVFEGGFLGLDNIGLFDRSKPLPVAGHLEQSDGTAWMAMYCLSMAAMAIELASHDMVYEDVASKFFEHFTYIAWAMSTQGLWDDEDGFFYDVVHLADGGRIPLRVRSMVGVVPLFAVAVLEPQVTARLTGFTSRMRWFVANKPDLAACVGHVMMLGTGDRRLLSVVDPPQLRRMLGRVLDEGELLSAHGLRSLSRQHGAEPVSLDLGGTIATVDYEPAESTNYLFGGNSNWRGPVWFPLNYLVIEALKRYHTYLGDGFTVEFPTGSGHQATLSQVADDLSRRLVSIFLTGPDGRRPVFGDQELLQRDPAWCDLVPFHEYFHAETGKGLGASHQTGWAGLVADLIARRRFKGPDGRH
jgi:hypothetical protein